MGSAARYGSIGIAAGLLGAAVWLIFFDRAPEPAVPVEVRETAVPVAPGPFGGLVERPRGEIRGRAFRIPAGTGPAALWAAFAPLLTGTEKVSAEGRWGKFPFAFRLTGDRFLLQSGGIEYTGKLVRGTGAGELRWNGPFDEWPARFRPAGVTGGGACTWSLRFGEKGANPVSRLRIAEARGTVSGGMAATTATLAGDARWDFRPGGYTADYARLRCGTLDLFAVRETRSGSRRRTVGTAVGPWFSGAVGFSADDGSLSFAPPEILTFRHASGWLTLEKAVFHNGVLSGALRSFGDTAEAGLVARGGRAELKNPGGWTGGALTGDLRLTGVRLALPDRFEQRDATVVPAASGTRTEIQFSGGAGRLGAVEFRRGAGTLRIGGDGFFAGTFSGVRLPVAGGRLEADSLEALGDAANHSFQLEKPVWSAGAWCLAAASGTLENGTLTLSGASGAGNTFTAREVRFGNGKITVRGGGWTLGPASASGIEFDGENLTVDRLTGAGPVAVRLRAEAAFRDGRLALRGKLENPDAGGVFFTAEAFGTPEKPVLLGDFKLPETRFAKLPSPRDFAPFPGNGGGAGSLAAEGKFRLDATGLQHFGEWCFRMPQLATLRVKASDAVLKLRRLPGEIRWSFAARMLEAANLAATEAKGEIVSTDGGKTWKLTAASDRGPLGTRRLAEPADGTEFELAVTDYPVGELYRELGETQAQISGTAAGTVRYAWNGDKFIPVAAHFAGTKLQMRGVPGKILDHPDAPFAAALLENFEAQTFRLDFDRTADRLVLTLSGAPAAPLRYRYDAGEKRFRPDASGRFDQSVELIVRATPPRSATASQTRPPAK